MKREKAGHFSHFTPNFGVTNLSLLLQICFSSVNSRRIFSRRESARIPPSANPRQARQCHLAYFWNPSIAEADGRRVGPSIRPELRIYDSTPRRTLAVDLRRSSWTPPLEPGVMIGDGVTRRNGRRRRRRGKTARRRRDCCASHNTNIYLYSHIHTHTHVRTHTRARLMRERRRRARSLACAEPRTAAVQLQLCVQAGNAGGGMEAARWAHSLPGPSVLHLRLSRPISLPFSLSFSVSLPRVPFITLLFPGVPLPRIVHFPLSLFLSVRLILPPPPTRRFAPMPWLLSFSLSLFKIPAGSFRLSSSREETRSSRSLPETSRLYF